MIIEQSHSQFLGVGSTTSQLLAFTLADKFRKWVLNDNSSEVKAYENENGAYVSNYKVALIAKVLPLRGHH